MRKSAPFWLVAPCLLAAACSSTPIVDTGRPGFDSYAYQRDLAECEAYADQVNPLGEAAGGAAVGAVAGAAMGAIAGAFTGSAGTGAAMGAALGGTGGAIGGTGDAVQRKREIVQNCLKGRGYSVLGY